MTWFVRGRVGPEPMTMVVFEHDRLQFLGPASRVTARVDEMLGKPLKLTPEGPRFVGSDSESTAAFYTTWLAFDEVDSVWGDAPEFPDGGVFETDPDDTPDDDEETTVTLSEWIHPRDFAGVYREEKHLRWPKGTPGGLGGHFRSKASAAKLSKLTGVPAAELLKNPEKATAGHAARKTGAPVPTGKTIPAPRGSKTPGAIDVGGDVRRAALLLSQGHAVSLRQPREVSILLEELGRIVADAVAKGDAAPSYDLCKVTVRNTSLFCVESKGIPRIKMPQLKGIPDAGSKADSKPKDKKGEVDLTADFVKYLETQGYKSKKDTEHAAYLKPSQNELNGAKVAGMVKWMKGGGNPHAGGSMLVTGDNYIVDGHHRWAAQIGIDAADNTLGNDRPINVTRVDMDIIDLLAEAVKYANENGLPNAGFGQPIPKAKP